MSQVKEAIAVVDKMVSTPEGTFDYKKGGALKRINYWINHMVDIPGNTPEYVQALVSKYAKVQLTPEECSTVIGILGLQPIVTAYKDDEILGQIELQYLNGKLSWVDSFGDLHLAPTITGLMNGAKEGIEREVVDVYRHQAVDEFTSDGLPRTKEDKIAGLIAFGLTYEEANKCQWSGSTVMNLEGNPIDFYGLAGIPG